MNAQTMRFRFPMRHRHRGKPALIQTEHFRKIRSAAQSFAWNLLLMLVGSVICSAAINGLLTPHQFLSGGFVGMAMVIQSIVPSLSITCIYILLNIPVYLLAWKYVGRRFFFYSVLGMLVFSWSMAWTQVSFPLQDKLLAALLAGIIIGIGSGIMLKSFGSAGGFDIVSVILLKCRSIRMDTTFLTSNALILALAAIFFSLEGALYTLISLVVSAYMVKLIVTGLQQRKVVHIISPAWEAIARMIKEEIQRGVTMIGARGGYSGNEAQLLYTVITFPELTRLKRRIEAIDPEAFVVVTDTQEVMGKRIGNQPHW